MASFFDVLAKEAAEEQKRLARIRAAQPILNKDQLEEAGEAFMNDVVRFGKYGPKFKTGETTQCAELYKTDRKYFCWYLRECAKDTQNLLTEQLQQFLYNKLYASEIKAREIYKESNKELQALQRESKKAQKLEIVNSKLPPIPSILKRKPVADEAAPSAEESPVEPTKKSKVNGGGKIKSAQEQEDEEVEAAVDAVLEAEESADAQDAEELIQAVNKKLAKAKKSKK
jgi:hypothetical protein